MKTVLWWRSNPRWLLLSECTIKVHIETALTLDQAAYLNSPLESFIYHSRQKEAPEHLALWIIVAVQKEPVGTWIVLGYEKPY